MGTWPSDAVVPEALRSLDLSTLVGCSPGYARALVEAAGGELRCYDDEQTYLTMEYRATRVTARVEDSRVAEIDGFG